MNITVLKDGHLSDKRNEPMFFIEFKDYDSNMSHTMSFNFRSLSILKNSIDEILRNINATI